MMRSVIGWRVKRVKIANMFFSEFFWLEGLGIYWRYRNRYRAFWVPEKSIGIGIGKIWYRKKVSVSVSSKFGTGKKYRYRYRQNLVPEKSIGIGIEDIWYRKKVSVSVSLKIMGTVTLWQGVTNMMSWDSKHLKGRSGPHVCGWVGHGFSELKKNYFRKNKPIIFLIYIKHCQRHNGPRLLSLKCISIVKNFEF